MFLVMIVLTLLAHPGKHSQRVHGSRGRSGKGGKKSPARGRGIKITSKHKAGPGVKFTYKGKSYTGTHALIKAMAGTLGG